MNANRILRWSTFPLTAILIANSCLAGWAPLRTSGSGKAGWQPLVCQTGPGWQSCELPVNISLTAAPTSLVAIGEMSTITASVTDYYGVAIEGATLNWTNTDGSISAWQTTTNASGTTSITLTSSRTIGGTTMTAETLEQDGKSSIFVPYIDKWIYYPSGFTAWSNSGGVYSCSTWSPDASTVPSGTWFTQYASCWQTQYQYRYDYEQSVVSGTIRQAGAPVALYQNVIVGVSQVNVGTLYVPPPPPSPPSGPICEYSGDTYFTKLTDCRGGGSVPPFYHGVRIPTGGVLNGIQYYKGAEMRYGGLSCAGSEGMVTYYQVCHD